MSQHQVSAITGIKKSDLFSHKISNVEKLATLFMTTGYDLSFGSVKKVPKLLGDMPSEIKNDTETMNSVVQFFKIIKNYNKMHDLILNDLDRDVNQNWGI